MTTLRARTAAAACAALLAATIAAATTSRAAIPATAHLAGPGLLAAGRSHALAVTPAGTVRAWGDNTFGQLGTGSTSPVSGAATVVAPSGSGSLTHVVSVAAGDNQSAAVRADGTVWTWGSSQRQAIARHAATASTRPVRLPSPSGTGAFTRAIAVTQGADFSLVLRSDGTVWAWGANDYGQLGIGSTTSSSLPVEVRSEDGSSVLTGVVAVSAGAKSAYALRKDGSVVDWGFNGDGELADKSTTNASLPEEPLGPDGSDTLRGIVQISGHDGTATALRSDGTVLSWGYGADGGLGTDSTDPSDIPKEVSALGHVITALGQGEAAYTTAAVSRDGRVFTWGYGGYGQLGTADPPSVAASPLRVRRLDAGSGVVRIAFGADFAAAVVSRGATLTWGRNDDRQLGDGTTVRSLEPVTASAVGHVGLPKLFLLTAPRVTGTVRVGHTLSVTNGSWGLPASSYAYRWYRSGKAIRGAVHHTYRLTSADRGHRVQARVYAYRAGYPSNYATTRSYAVRMTTP